ncbi:DUF6993 domain-containing protein [Agromyces silvae]|uniref:DUF6993 domain-containing protein n=1 Tax=Agromyces silvae TaxID=3388266 RepID=UPI00280A9ADD|nr:hypothetical protein [Agromyces protaetiae]
MALAFAGATLMIGLTGCSFGDAQPSPSPTQTAAPTEAPPAPPEFHPDLSATENLPFFDSVNQSVVAADPNAGGRAFIDALVAAGFDKAAMQVTADRTTIDEAADSVQFSVAFQGECLVGQYGPKSGGYHGAVRPILGTGTCLVGQTRPIDW